MSHKQVISFPERKTVRNQASEWIARLDVDEPSTADMREFKRWVNQNPEHYHEFKRLNSVWEELNLLTQLKPEKSETVGRRDSGGGFVWRSAIAVVALFFVVLGFETWLESPDTYETLIGEQKVIKLPDDSVVTLNTDSRIDVRYTEGRRTISLRRGEAHFNVEKDHKRPFDVYVGKGVVRAVGTAFSVRLKPDNVEVLVNEGVVKVDAFALPARKEFSLPDRLDMAVEVLPPPARLIAGEQANFHREAPTLIEQKKVEAMSRKLSWREGTLEFERERLEYVVEEMNRYTNSQLVITDKNAREQLVGGRFKVGETKVLLEVLESAFGITVSRVDDQSIYLSYAKNKAKE